MTNEKDCTSFFELINQIETAESNISRNWNSINREARFAERVKAYEKIFYRFLDELDSLDNENKVARMTKNKDCNIRGGS